MPLTFPLAGIVRRLVKGSRLTREEGDGNLDALEGAIQTAYNEAIKTTDATPLTDVTLPLLASDETVIFRGGVGYKAPLSAIKTFVLAASAPAAFTAGQWTATAGIGSIELNITALPDNGGSALTSLQYSLDGGSPVTLSGGATTGIRTITGLTGGTPYGVQIRAVNAVGEGAWSDTKTRTPTGAALSVAYLGVRDRTGVGAFTDFTNPSPTAGQRLVVIVSGEAQSPGNYNITVNGGSTLTPIQVLGGLGDNAMAMFETAAPAGGTISITVGATATEVSVTSCSAYIVTNGTLRGSNIVRGASPQSTTVDVAAGGAVIAGISSTWYNAPTLAFTAGATSDGANGNGHRTGSATGLSANAAYTVSGTTSAGNAAIAVASFQP